MKHMTIWQRLNTALALLILLLMVGFGLYVWQEKVGWASIQRTEQLAAAKDRIYFDLIRMSDGLRGLLLDPKNDLEKKRRHEAETD